MNLLMKMEAPPGFEPGVEVLQTSALPLGDGASVGEWLTRTWLRHGTSCDTGSVGLSVDVSAGSASRATLSPVLDAFERLVHPPPRRLQVSRRGREIRVIGKALHVILRHVALVDANRRLGAS